MRLIIDIDEKLYKVVQNEVKGKINVSNIWTAIANGTPYEEQPQGDLISREALKKSLNFVYGCAYIESKSKEGIASDIIEEIDNAQTVETPTIYEFKGCDNCELERPHGEWINRKHYQVDEDGYDTMTCNKCGKEIDLPRMEDYYFCPICGAKMKQG